MGRPKKYIEDEVLLKAMNAFWERGYRNTSIRMLEMKMGINQFSIYASFKSKRDLFKKSLKRYEKEIRGNFLGQLERKDSSIIDIRDFMMRFAKAIISRDVPSGCLMVKTLTDMQGHDQEIKDTVTEFFSSMKLLFLNALTNSQQQGGIRQGLSLDHAAEYLVGIAQSLSVIAKLKSQKQVNDYIHFSLNVLN